jgi:phage gp37-like protein
MVDFEKTEDALIADMKANGPGLRTIDTFETTYSEKTLKELMPLAPFVLIQWGGLIPEESERGATGGSTTKHQDFHCIVGAQSVRSMKERQRGCYPIIKWIINQYDGKSVIVDGEAVPFALRSVVPLESDPGTAAYDVVLTIVDE